MKDLLKTARVLSRFGPKLPQLAEAALVRTYNTTQPSVQKQGMKKRWLLLALFVGGGGGWLAAHLI
jgi:ubiquinone biosynthesis protein